MARSGNGTLQNRLPAAAPPVQNDSAAGAKHRDRFTEEWSNRATHTIQPTTRDHHHVVWQASWARPGRLLPNQLRGSVHLEENLLDSLHRSTWWLRRCRARPRGRRRRACPPHLRVAAQAGWRAEERAVSRQRRKAGDNRALFGQR